MPVARNIWAVPGGRGQGGAAAANGTDGVNAFTLTTAEFTQPAAGATVLVAVENSQWSAVGQIVFIEGGGYYEVTAKPSATQLTVENLNYAANAAPATVIALGKRVSPSGVAGSAGSDADAGVDSDARVVVTNATDAPVNAFNLGALTTGLVKITVAAGTATPSTATPGTDYPPPSDALNALGLCTPAANRLPYFDSASTSDTTLFTLYARNFMGAANASDAITALGLGSMSLQGDGAVAITGGTLDDVTLGNVTTISERLVLTPAALTTLANGNNADISLFGATSYLVTTGPTAAFTICGIVAGSNGEIKIIQNTTAYDMTIANESGVEATATRRILTNTGADVTTTAGGCVTLQYNTTDNRWRMISYLG